MISAVGFPSERWRSSRCPTSRSAKKRRAMLAEGKARDPGFVLSKAEYDAAAEEDWLVGVNAAGQFTAEHVLGRRQ